MAPEKILVFIPAYNCEAQIPRVLKSFQDPDVSKYFSEILILDNGSKDKTVEAATQMAKTLNGIEISIGRNDGNYNLGGSHKVAFQWARDHGFDTLVVLHGDDQGSITDLIPILQKGKYRDFDCVLGARFHPESKLVGYSWFRTFGNQVFNALFSLAVGKRLYDLGSGLNLYRVRSFPEINLKSFPDDLTFNYCMILASCYRKQKFQFFPITWREDDQISNVKLFSQAKKVLKFLLSYVIRPGKFIVAEHRNKMITHYSTKIVATNQESL